MEIPGRLWDTPFYISKNVTKYYIKICPIMTKIFPKSSKLGALNPIPSLGILIGIASAYLMKYLVVIHEIQNIAPLN